jgi:predicted RNA polymerase sigma factor
MLCQDEDLRENIRILLVERLHRVAVNARKSWTSSSLTRQKQIWTVNPQREKQVVKLQQKRIEAMTQELEDLESQEEEYEDEDEEKENTEMPRRG